MIESKSVKKIQKAVKKAKGDLPDGTVVTWVANERYNYCAIKANGFWFTSSTATNRRIPQVIDFERLLLIFERAETSQVRIIGLEDGTPITA